ncbi:hypothetical protein BJ508DRAFT_309785 [Ascobolus immersus RN42]|uniref:Uncharacterized protein n=1 Tax=Ascobolus immersus RN42 TaxID=1160509 RepID=A0A3N4HVE3_ASCIM|nr:hypothetical protein BJ508DRAFT_309785 [Ascobolus immersus RN42]
MSSRMWPFRRSKTNGIFNQNFSFQPPVRTPTKSEFSVDMQLSPGTKIPDPFARALPEANDDGSIIISRPVSEAEPANLSFITSPPLSAHYEEQEEEDESDDGAGSFICNDSDSIISVASSEIQTVTYQQIIKRRVPQPIWTSPTPPGSRDSNRSGLRSPIQINTNAKPVEEEQTGWKALNRCAVSDGIELQLRVQNLLRDSPSEDVVEEEDSFVTDSNDAWLADRSPSTLRRNHSNASTFQTFGIRTSRTSLSSFHTAQPTTSWFSLDSAVSTPVTEERQSWLPGPSRLSELSDNLDSVFLQFEHVNSVPSTPGTETDYNPFNLAPPPLSHSVNSSTAATPLCPTPETRSSVVPPTCQIEDSLAKLNEICAREFAVDGIDQLLRPKSAGSDGGYGALRWEDDEDAASSGGLATFLLD